MEKAYTTAGSAKKAAVKAAAKCSDDLVILEINTRKTTTGMTSSYIGRVVVDQMSISAADAELLEGFAVVDQAGNSVRVRPEEGQTDPEQAAEVGGEPGEASPDEPTSEPPSEPPSEPVGEPADPLPPAVLEGANVNQLTRADVRKQRHEWFHRHGLLSDEQLASIKEDNAVKVGKLPAETRYTFIGEKNHRTKPTGIGYQMIEWLIKHPGSTRAQMAEAGFPAVHIRWDMERSPHLFRVEIPGQPSVPDPDDEADEDEPSQEEPGASAEGSADEENGNPPEPSNE